ncbi:selenocysteine-specific translation elongation factor [Edwardsiella piscicida]|uniref:selenocysteine-specific translation elongation factor n=1 Tax=Edwardsiella piscicida TaxID=1263550 RepID=UPI0002C11342|nr:selenocysteine-specific translation elongation factor [Edwardsiella piscicida]AGH75097.1 selenocysteinyl-tRNA-specific translation factor [Edwardsiella piscicida C07-087]EKS7781326.1 selenocysteine-specific translation elongation factor [Edwardsiella piscicida]EKS7784562.1 selenocysteine-specific translation elongation factor [Edwardsiella piscicida]UCQ24108.1 selenocysteine-specific translation elongation factor [Edwardsiella piscicida]UCQ34248.1 selenocysteine-specific translation elongat
MIIATAGHVDHGKTTLLRALTGIDTDRLPEEKRRGMTIDLGYAYLPLADGRVLGFIDVPGHEKFLANMLAGIGGIPQALLVVACDDGVMAQTREHLLLLRLAGRPGLTVALTKSDRADAPRRAQVREQVQALLAEQGWPDAALFETDALSGQGIEALRRHLLALSAAPPQADRRFRLAIDRAFSVKGSGLVVTGTALAGTVRCGDTLWLTGCDKAVRVRTLHAQNREAQQAQAGQRVALNLSGDVEKNQIQRGDWLLAQRPAVPAAQRVLVAVDGIAPLQHWQPLHLHHAARHITGRLSLLETAAPQVPILAELVLDAPLWLAEGDTLILRDIAARHTLGAARVLQLEAPRRGKRQPAFLATLRHLAQARGDREALSLRLPSGTLSIASLAWARQLTEDACRALLAQDDLLVVGDHLLSRATAARLRQRLLETLAHYHEQHGDQLGVGRARLRRMALPTEAETLVFHLIGELLAEGALCNSRGWLHLPQHSLAMTPPQQALWQRAQPLFADDPWWVRDLANALNADEDEMRQTLRQAALLGHITAVVRDRYYRSERLYQFAELIRRLDRSQGSTSAADFRDQLGVGRKLAVQILEFFDRCGFTRRRANDHLLRDSALFCRDERASAPEDCR